MTIAPETISIPGSGLEFDNTYGANVTAGLRLDIIDAEAFYETEFNNPVTLNMFFDVQALPGTGTSGNLAETINVSYTQLVSALAAKATTANSATAVDNLPATDPSNGAGFTLPLGYAKMLGLYTVGDQNGVKGTPALQTFDPSYTGDSDLNEIIINSNAGFNLSGLSGDVVSTLEHEISEGAMGRLGGLGRTHVNTVKDAWSTMDLFRFTANGQRDFTAGTDSVSTYFGVDSSTVYSLAGLTFNGVNNLGSPINYDLADWDSSGGVDSYGNGGPGFDGPISEIDLLEMNALGWSNSGNWTTQDSNPRELGDVTAAGAPADIVGFGNDGVYVAAANNSVDNIPALKLAQFGAVAGGWISQDTYPRLLGDVTGNGIDDILGFGSDGVYEALGTGNESFGSLTKVLSGFGNDATAGGWTSNNIYPRELADVTGDGRDDIIAFASDGVYESLANASGTFQSPSLVLAALGNDATAGGWTDQNTYPRALGDVTGNGRDDIVAFASNGVYVSLANADGTFQAPFLALSALGNDAAAGGWASQDTYPRLLADVTGNGRDDIVAFASNGVYVSLANADGTFQAPFLALSAFGTDAGFIGNNIYPRELSDVTGNGRADIVAFANNGVYVALGNTNGTFSTPTFDLENFGTFSAI
jgi:hypothetical protein